jgi:hypothetical protein
MTTVYNLNSFESDDCCGVDISAAALCGMLDDVDEWTHEQCGTRWRATLYGSVRHWQPVCEVLVVPHQR